MAEESVTSKASGALRNAWEFATAAGTFVGLTVMFGPLAAGGFTTGVTTSAAYTTTGQAISTSLTGVANMIGSGASQIASLATTSP